MVVITAIGCLAISVQWWSMSRASGKERMLHFGLLACSAALVMLMTWDKNIMLLQPLRYLFEGMTGWFYQIL
ncbi:hypothetical protein [Alicyclobacillus fodiniaquatilis]|uniref:Uncharacterized protein n=1 Tax=Alicyclobacillus fodiniaquatilis TaxID=1661150 RepID=A0ABW4JN76_9BACL